MLVGVGAQPARWQANTTLSKAAFLTRLLVVLSITLRYFSASAIVAPPGDKCGFQTYTQGQNGYGMTANGSGNANSNANPKANSNTLLAYMGDQFPAAFPKGLTVGCAGGYTLKLTSVEAISAFLPSSSRAAQALNASYTNPVKPTGNPKKEIPNAYASSFAGEVVALSLSVGFDDADADFSSGDTQLKDAVVTEGTFSGKTVAFVLAQANLALGGCSSKYSLAELQAIVQAINEGYDVGRSSSLLSCPATPPAPPVCSLVAPVANPAAYCLGAAANLLSSTVTVSAGATVRLYTAATGGTPLSADFRPVTTVTGSTTYYASQVVGTCESPRASFEVSVVAAPGAPTLVPGYIIDKQNVAAWGDSFTDIDAGLFPRVLTQLSGLNVVNLGIGGQTSAAIKDRMLADPQKHTWPTIIWAGRNDLNYPEQVKASIAAMVAALPHSNYLILPVFNGLYEDNQYNPTMYGYVTDLNKELAAIYGNHFLDVRSYIVSQYDPSSPQDVLDHNADVPPSSLRQDFLHLNAKGTTLAANYVYAHFNQLMSGGPVVRYCQNAQATALSTAFNTVPAGATLRYYTSAEATTPVGTGNDFAPSTATVGDVTYYVAQGVGKCESARVAITVSVASCASPSLRSATTSSSTLQAMSAQSANAAVASAMAPALAVYPNPFTQQATIDFALTAGQSYKLELYNSIGQLVQRSVVGVATADQRYTYQLNGHELAAGLYTARLTAGKTCHTVHFTLVK
jgi:lysophospholipase L1-like esterase